MTAVTTRRESFFEGKRVLQCYADRPRGMHAMLEASIERLSEREAVVCGNQRLGWGALGEQVRCLACGLAQLGVGTGDRVALMLGNRIEFVVAAFAISRIGAIVVPISIREKAPGIRHMLNDSGAALLIYESDLHAVLPPEADAPSLLARVAVKEIGQADPFGALYIAGGDTPIAQVKEEDCAAILYTSGTTDQPKGAMLAHMNIVHSAMHYATALGLSHEDRICATVPLSHVTGLAALMATAVNCAATLIIMPVFKASNFLELAARERMAYTLMVPAMYNLCLLQEDCRQYDLSSWRIGAFGGAIMPQATIETLAGVWPGMVLVNVYGATEATSPATIMPQGAGMAHPNSVGIPVRCGDIVVMDEQGREVAPGEPGELWIRGPMVVPGYWNNPIATADSFVGGYWRSGDIGSIDSEGYVSVFDRRKDVINRGGYKIFSSEVENVLCRHPQVIEAAVIARPCPVLGERVHAVVVTKERAVTEADLQAFCSGLLADYQVPESFSFLREPLPRNANGKVLKKALRERLVPDA